MIAKNCLFVIFVVVTLGIFPGCGTVSPETANPATVASFDSPKVNGRIKSADISESSGIAASKCQKDVLWTHNDSGDEAFIYAVGVSGDDLGTWRLPNTENIDWEDIAAFKDANGKCFIYIGEIGDNKGRRSEHAVIRVAEPIITRDSAAASRSEPLTTAVPDSAPFSYPDLNQDAEALMVHPVTGDIYIITKRVSGPAGIYRVKPSFGSPTIHKAERVGSLSVPAIPNGFLTGGDISPDGKRLVICDYTQAYEYSLPSTTADFAKIWIQTPEMIDLGKRKGGESVCYSVDGASLFATSEGKNSPVIEVRRLIK